MVSLFSGEQSFWPCISRSVKPIASHATQIAELGFFKFDFATVSAMKSALSTWLESQGVSLTNDRGVELPDAFTSPQDEYTAVCERAGLIDLSFRTQVKFTGEDRIDFLQGMLSNDVKALRPGEGCPATLLTEQGRIVADLRVYAEESAILLDLDTRIKEKTIEALDRFIIADDVEIEDLSAHQVTLAVQGPTAAEIVAAAGLSSLPEQELQHRDATIAEVQVRVIRSDQTGKSGYEFHVPSDRAAVVWQALAQLDGLLPVGHTALNILRVEAGIPWYGLDMDEDRIVLEVGLDRAISFNKGCYLGQEVVERASARGHMNRLLIGFLLQDEGPDVLPTRGDRLLKDDKEVGWLTSVTTSPTLGRPIALGYVRREHGEPGTRLRIDRPDTDMIVEVTKLPFLQ